MKVLISTIYSIQIDWIANARDEWKNDKEAWKLIQKLQQDPSTSHIFIWKNDSTQIAYIFIRIPNSNKIFFWNCTPPP